MMQQPFVTFYSPGTFFSEETTQPIDSWDVAQAVQMARAVLERYNATPFGFRFSLRERADDELDSHETARSPMYYLGGTVLTLQDVKDRHDPKDAILLGNMEGNGYEKVIQNDNSWRVTFPLHEEDIVLDFTVDKRRTEVRP